eukprot:scaffold455_cov160-Pinguiococcus_pyrenoidosus.AAC.2
MHRGEKHLVSLVKCPCADLPLGHVPKATSGGNACCRVAMRCESKTAWREQAGSSKAFWHPFFMLRRYFSW